MARSDKNNDYKYIAASEADTALARVGSTVGAAGDFLSHLLVVPETVSAGTISIKDGSGSSRNVFISGTLPSLVPFTIPIQTYSAVGQWTITTGAAVHVFAVGSFS